MGKKRGEEEGGVEAAEESSQCRTAGPCQGQLSFSEIKELPTNWGMAGRELYAKLALRVERKANMNKNSLYDAIDEHFTQNECSTPTVHSSLAPRHPLPHSPAFHPPCAVTCLHYGNDF